MLSKVALGSVAGLPLAIGLFSAVGYPALLRVRAKGRRSPIVEVLSHADQSRALGSELSLPTVSAIVATREPPTVIESRVRDLRGADYPQHRLEIIVAVDASSPFATEAYEAALAADTRVVRGDIPGGKSAALNAGVRASTGEVLLFADSAQRFAATTVRDLVIAVGAEHVGAVSGVIAPAADDTLLDRYWAHELRLRHLQSAIHSIICVSGAVYTMRRELWRPMPTGLICDDLFATTQVILQGWRVVICDRAVATDSRRFTRDQHFQRKVRTLTGLIQLCLWTPAILNPWRNATWLDLLVHKIMRVLLPYIALSAAIASAWLAAVLAGRAVIWCGLIFLAFVVGVGMVRPVVLSQAVWAIRLSTAPVLALTNAVRGHWGVWKPGSTVAIQDSVEVTVR